MLELAERERGEPVAAALVAREHRLVDDDDVSAATLQLDRRRGAGRSGADDEHVAGESTDAGRRRDRWRSRRKCDGGHWHRGYGRPVAECSAPAGERHHMSAHLRRTGCRPYDAPGTASRTTSAPWSTGRSRRNQDEPPVRRPGRDRHRSRPRHRPRARTQPRPARRQGRRQRPRRGGRRQRRRPVARPAGRRRDQGDGRRGDRQRRQRRQLGGRPAARSTPRSRRSAICTSWSTTPASCATGCSPT